MSEFDIKSLTYRVYSTLLTTVEADLYDYKTICHYLLSALDIIFLNDFLRESESPHRELVETTLHARTQEFEELEKTINEDIRKAANETAKRGENHDYD